MCGLPRGLLFPCLGLILMHGLPWACARRPPPSRLFFVQVFSESANHSGLQADETAAVVETAEALQKGAMYADLAEGGENSKPFRYSYPQTASLLACRRT